MTTNCLTIFYWERKCTITGNKNFTILLKRKNFIIGGLKMLITIRQKDLWAKGYIKLKVMRSRMNCLVFFSNFHRRSGRSMRKIFVFRGEWVWTLWGKLSRLRRIWSLEWRRWGSFSQKNKATFMLYLCCASLMHILITIAKLTTVSTFKTEKMSWTLWNCLPTGTSQINK